MLPSPRSISAWWSIGSILGLCLGVQLITGLFLALHYAPRVVTSFPLVLALGQDVNRGWLVRIAHANGARLFFAGLYLHAGRGIYFGSFRLREAWRVGVVLFLLVIAAAFLGYVLPWGQISFWGATVITRLLTAIPYIGNSVVLWLWGGFSVDGPTLSRFFAFHFLVPFIVAALAVVHLFFLHLSGSSNPLGVRLNKAKVPLSPYFLIKDIIGFLIIGLCLLSLVCFAPWDLGDPENFIPANPLMAPLHIQPEWYFLFAYAILRSIPNKLGGVVALGLSILILLIMPFLTRPAMKAMSFYPTGKFWFWALVNRVLLLTWIGARPVEAPYVLTGQVISVLYFAYFFAQPLNLRAWDRLLRG